jgi:hypothetical protein
LFDDQGSEPGLEELNDWDRLTLKAVESFAHKVFTVVRALNQLATATRANGWGFQSIGRRVIKFAAFAANPPAAEPMKDDRKVQVENDHGGETELMPMEQVEEGLNLNGRTWNAIEENNAAGALLQFPVHDLLDEPDWGQRARSDVALEALAERSAFPGFAGEEGPDLNDGESAAFGE